MTDKADVFCRARPILADEIERDSEDITRDTHFVNDLEIDSFDHVQIVMAIEDEFDIAISDEEAQMLETVGQVVDFITEKLREQS